MLSGSRGLHIWVPLDRSASVEEAVTFAGDTAEALVSRHPDTLTTEFSKKDRGDRIYVDIARNAPGQHAVCPYSLRAKDGAPAATPIDWDELSPRLTSDHYTIANLPKRLAGLRADPWARYASVRQRLPAVGRT